MKNLLQYRKNRNIDSLWTQNGRTYAKKTKDDDPVKLRCSEDIFDKLKLERVEDELPTDETEDVPIRLCVRFISTLVVCHCLRDKLLPNSAHI